MSDRSRARTGPWPASVPIEPSGAVAEGLVVRSRSGAIEGRTTGRCRPCSSHACPGWFIGVLWETGQQMYLCSEGWRYDAATRMITVVAGGEISARFVSPPPLGTPPLPRDHWPDRSALAHRKGWRVSIESARLPAVEE